MGRSLLFFLFLLASSQAIHAHPGHVHPESGSGIADDPKAPATAAGPKERAARLFFSDRKLVTQNGDRMAFYTDVLRDKAVLISFVFTQCTDACPTQTARVAEVQALLGDRVGRGVSLVSISVDPEHDTPTVLKEYGARFGARDGWTFLTGAKSDVDDVLRRLGQLVPIREAHTTLFLLGNARTGHWLKVHPDAAPDEIARLMRTLDAESSARPTTLQTTQPGVRPVGVVEKR